MEMETPASQDKSPELWNPSVAIGWSLLLTPAFGAYLHAANWRALNEPQKAAEQKSWFWVSIVFTVLSLLAEFLPTPRALDALFRLVGLCFFIGWYRSQARHQVVHFREVLENRYSKKGWGRPLLAGFTPIVVLLGLVFVMDNSASTPQAALSESAKTTVALSGSALTPDALATELRPSLMKQWMEVEGFQGVEIKELTLTVVKDKPNTYTGPLEAVIDGDTMHYQIHVTVANDQATWELEDLGSDPPANPAIPGKRQ